MPTGLYKPSLKPNQNKHYFQDRIQGPELEVNGDVNTSPNSGERRCLRHVGQRRRKVQKRPFPFQKANSALCLGTER